jgi:predicted transcriptional regulator
MVKMTFTLDDETVAALRQASERLAKPQSVIVREAIREYGARAGRLNEEERRRMLRSIDAVLTQPPTRTVAAVERELRELRDSRRRGGRRSA